MQRETMKINIADEAKEELWAIYAWWSCILVLKMNALTWFTGRIRVSRRVIHSEEDRMWMKGPVTLCSTGGGHPDVDRIRAAHHYDLRTVLPYLVTAPIWLSTLPSYFLARIILPCFAIASILYTLIHMRIVQTPPRYKTALTLVKYCILFYVSAMSICHYST